MIVSSGEPQVFSVKLRRHGAGTKTDSAKIEDGTTRAGPEGGLKGMETSGTTVCPRFRTGQRNQTRDFVRRANRKLIPAPFAVLGELFEDNLRGTIALGSFAASYIWILLLSSATASFHAWKLSLSSHSSRSSEGFASTRSRAACALWASSGGTAIGWAATHSSMDSV